MGDREENAGLAILPFASSADWRAWLADHGASSPGLWLKTAKKGSGVPSVTYAEALDEALCRGWIDGQKAPFDDSFYLLRFTRRGPRSRWSQINRAKAESLMIEGRMTTAGLREVEAAKADGRWDRAYASQSTMTVPDDLAESLEADQGAREFFGTLDATNRYAILYRIHDAKRSETRASRIAKFVAMLARGETIHPARKSKNQDKA